MHEAEITISQGEEEPEFYLNSLLHDLGDHGELIPVFISEELPPLALEDCDFFAFPRHHLN